MKLIQAAVLFGGLSAAIIAAPCAAADPATPAPEEPGVSETTQSGGMVGRSLNPFFPGLIQMPGEFVQGGLLPIFQLAPQ